MKNYNYKISKYQYKLETIMKGGGVASSRTASDNLKISDKDMEHLMHINQLEQENEIAAALIEIRDKHPEKLETSSSDDKFDIISKLKPVPSESKTIIEFPKDRFSAQECSVFCHHLATNTIIVVKNIANSVKIVENNESEIIKFNTLGGILLKETLPFPIHNSVKLEMCCSIDIIVFYFFIYLSLEHVAIHLININTLKIIKSTFRIDTHNYSIESAFYNRFFILKNNTVGILACHKVNNSAPYMDVQFWKDPHTTVNADNGINYPKIYDKDTITIFKENMFSVSTAPESMSTTITINPDETQICVFMSHFTTLYLFDIKDGSLIKKINLSVDTVYKKPNFVIQSSSKYNFRNIVYGYPEYKISFWNDNSHVIMWNIHGTVVIINIKAELVVFVENISRKFFALKNGYFTTPPDDYKFIVLKNGDFAVYYNYKFELIKNIATSA